MECEFDFIIASEDRELVAAESKEQIVECRTAYEHLTVYPAYYIMSGNEFCRDFFVVYLPTVYKIERGSVFIVKYYIGLYNPKFIVEGYRIWGFLYCARRSSLARCRLCLGEGSHYTRQTLSSQPSGNTSLWCSDMIHIILQSQPIS